MALRARLHAWGAALHTTTLPRPRRIDWALAALIAAVGIVEPLFADLPGLVPASGVGVVSVMAFVVRRVSPLGAVLAGGLTQAAADLYAVATGNPVEPLAASIIVAGAVVYNAGRWGSARTVGIAAFLAAVAIPALGSQNTFTEPNLILSALDGLVAIVLLTTGLLIRISTDARAQRDLATALQERDRLANQIHDSFAHHMSAIAVRAEAARRLDDPEALDDALLAIKRSASTGLTDLRHLVAGIRTPGTETRPLPGLGDIQQLAADHRTDALDIRVDLHAQPEVIPVTASSAAYWIAREAVTNAFRHAVGASSISITACTTDDRLDLVVADDGRGSSAAGRRGGHGLTSMSQRAEELGGTLCAGPDQSGGWSVTARLPLNRGEA
ncbi:MAG: sensor histidine kinase [Actinomycetota bacterium]